MNILWEVALYVQNVPPSAAFMYNRQMTSIKIFSRMLSCLKVCGATNVIWCNLVIGECVKRGHEECGCDEGGEEGCGCECV